ncbi:IclR family transcriptional regulator C-terminal domain-containing protein [Halomonas sp. CSM-2]|uniref:IclR family transcriptional regulator C-terminal domain-containing protein n=1 Tax=Halomonas sp. CSM-2 TaxID=1975722 RepID=UPI0020CB5EB0|nr:IclR family transcriptional regulator C-terminal domain-containing protein [Halomonas sp. CSM-2]
MAAPTFDANCELLGAINVSTNAARVELETLLRDYLPVLQRKSYQIRSLLH